MVELLGNTLVVRTQREFDVAGDVGLRGTQITALPDGLTVGGGTRKDF